MLTSYRNRYFSFHSKFFLFIIGIYQSSQPAMALLIDRAIGFAGLVSGLPGLIEVCIHLGDFVVNRLGAYQKWDVSVADYALKVSVHWDIQKHGLMKLQRLGNDVETDVKARLAQVLLRLKQLLEDAGTVLSRHVPAHDVKSSASGSSFKRLKFSLFEDKALADLDKRIGEWETLFNKQLVLVVESTPDLSSATENEQLGYQNRSRLMADRKRRRRCPAYTQLREETSNTPESCAKYFELANAQTSPA
jgi:hypothetical protein